MIVTSCTDVIGKMIINFLYTLHYFPDSSLITKAELSFLPAVTRAVKIHPVNTYLKPNLRKKIQQRASLCTISEISQRVNPHFLTMGIFVVPLTVSLPECAYTGIYTYFLSTACRNASAPSMYSTCTALLEQG